MVCPLIIPILDTNPVGAGSNNDGSYGVRGGGGGGGNTSDGGDGLAKYQSG